MKYLPIIGLTAALVCYADLAIAKTPAEIESISKAITVEIRLLKDESVGSGIIIEHKGDLYTLITNRHVVCGQIRKCSAPPSGETYTVKLGDGQKYQVSAKSVKLLGNDLDLAIIQFRSNRTYPVAQIDDSGSLKVGDPVYTSGYPLTPPGFSFNAGSAIAVVNKRLTEDRGGYTIVYDAETQPGMSGGGVFSQEGRLVAIHGQGEKYRENTELATLSDRDVNNQKIGSKIGANRGIPVQWVIKGLIGRGIGLANPQPVDVQTLSISADEHFIAGFNKFVEPGVDVAAGKRAAVREFSQSIRIDPRYAIAYFMRAITYEQLQEDRLAIADYDFGIALQPKDAAALYLRGNLKSNKLNDFQGALADYDRAIVLRPKYADFYNNRGFLKKNKLNDSQGALADYNRAIELNSNLPNIYYNRGSLKNEIKDFQGALADYNRAIEINPQYADVYVNRGILKEGELNDHQGALADYDRTITLDPKNCSVYSIRGYLKYMKLDNRSGGIMDVRQSAKLARLQGNSHILQFALQILRFWRVGE